jgi:hypothetical protein
MFAVNANKRLGAGPQKFPGGKFIFSGLPLYEFSKEAFI